MATRWKIDEDGLLIERPHAGVRLDPEEADALLDALLRERGFERRLAIGFDDSTWSEYAGEPDGETCWIHVPVQGEGE